MGIIRRTKSVDLLLDEFEKESSAIATTTLIDRLNSLMNKTTIYRVLDKLEDDVFFIHLLEATELNGLQNVSVVRKKNTRIFIHTSNAWNVGKWIVYL